MKYPGPRRVGHRDNPTICHEDRGWAKKDTTLYSKPLDILGGYVPGASKRAFSSPPRSIVEEGRSLIKPLDPTLYEKAALPLAWVMSSTTTLGQDVYTFIVKNLL